MKKLLVAAIVAVMCASCTNDRDMCVSMYQRSQISEGKVKSDYEQAFTEIYQSLDLRDRHRVKSIIKELKKEQEAERRHAAAVYRADSIARKEAAELLSVN